jgi:hypothetical protein
VVLSTSLTGQVLTSYFDQRSLGVFPKNRLCRGVLTLPGDHSDYVRGRRRQALRTNLRRAKLAGIRCEAISDPRRAFDELATVLKGRETVLTLAELPMVADWQALLARPEMTLMVARDQFGHPLAFAGAAIDDEVCLIRMAVASNHDARWALHDHLVRILIERGVRYLLGEGDGPLGALGFGANVHHYQHLLGYELRHLRPRTTRRPAAPAEESSWFAGDVAAPSFHVEDADPFAARNGRRPVAVQTSNQP